MHVYTGYSPRPAFMPFHNRTQRWGEMICHRRAGKTVAAVNDLQKKALECKLPHPRFAFMAPSRVRAKDIAWEYLKRYSAPIPGARPNESELFVEFPNKGRVTLYGADNERAMGLYLDGIIYDESDDIPPKVHTDIVRPALADRYELTKDLPPDKRSGWAIWMGILRGRHNLFKLYEQNRNNPAHFSLMLKASESGIISPDEQAEMRTAMGDSAYLLQMECDVNQSLANAIYGAQMSEVRRQGRIRPINADPTAPMFTFWDIGHSDRGDDTTVWLAQLVATDWVLLDYHARTGEVPAYYAAKVREWEDIYGLSVTMNFLPHDGSNRNVVGKTYPDYLKEAGLTRTRVVARPPNRWDSINLVRSLLTNCYINQGPCSATWVLGDIEMPSGIDCLDYYSKKVEAQSGIITDVPIHNQYSHGADALRTLAEASKQGMVSQALLHKIAREEVEHAPRYPDGTLADTSLRKRHAHRQTALSGHRPL
jgi:phage terminase large subunit